MSAPQWPIGALSVASICFNGFIRKTYCPVYFLKINDIKGKTLEFV